MQREMLSSVDLGTMFFLFMHVALESACLPSSFFFVQVVDVVWGLV